MKPFEYKCSSCGWPSNDDLVYQGGRYYCEFCKFGD